MNAKEIKVTEDFYIKGETVIYGQLQRVGGKQPKIRLETDDGIHLYINVDESTAKELAKHLYTTIGVQGIATWRRDNREICQFKFEKFSSIKDGTLSDKLNELKGKIKDYWVNIDNPSEYISKLRSE